jgi:hypothetical protein
MFVEYDSQRYDALTVSFLFFCFGWYPPISTTHTTICVSTKITSAESNTPTKPNALVPTTNYYYYYHDTFFNTFKILTKADTLRNMPMTASSIYLQKELDASLEREIASLWQSDEVSRLKPTPEDEAARGTLVVETVLWEALPGFLRKLDATLQQHDVSLPLTAAPIVYSSWMGGDRDGNPNVTPETTRTVCLSQRARAAGLLARDLKRLERELSITNCSAELAALVGSEAAREPYRAYLKPVRREDDDQYCVVADGFFFFFVVWVRKIETPEEN